MARNSVDGFISRQEALKLSKLKLRTFQRRLEDGTIEYKRLNGRHWYSEEDCRDIGASDDPGDDPAIEERRQLVRAMKQSQDHSEGLLKLVTEPLQEINRHYIQLVKQLGKRIDDSDKRWVSMLELTEQLTTAAHERELELQRETRKEERIDDALQAAKAGFPRVVDGLMRANLMKDFFRRLAKTGKAEALIDEETGFLDEAEAATLQTILANLAEKEESNGTDTRKPVEEGNAGPPGGAGGAGASSGGSEGSDDRTAEGANGAASHRDDS